MVHVVHNSFRISSHKKYEEKIQNMQCMYSKQKFQKDMCHMSASIGAMGRWAAVGSLYCSGATVSCML
jgi:hypothetical protein